MAKGIGLQLASLGSSRQGTAKYIPKKNDKTRNSRKKTHVKKNDISRILSITTLVARHSMAHTFCTHL